MKRFYLFVIGSLLLGVLNAQTVLLNYNFQSALPTGVVATYNGGALSTSKTADGVCSLGAATINSGGNLQVSVASCSVFRVNMKSSGASARTVTVKYKLQSDASFTTLTTALSVQAAASFDFHTLYPSIIGGSPITISIEPTNGNIQIHDLYVEGSSAVSSAAEITAFNLPSQIGSATINSAAATIAVSVPIGTSLTSVVPSTLTLSPSATVNPTAATARDFSSPVTYTVTAQNGTTTKVWTVTVTIVASSAKEITAFQLSNMQIGASVINSAAGTIAVSMPIGSTLTNLVPTTLTLSPSATVSPLPSVAQDFSAPVVYTVTAQDNTTKTWTVTVSLVDPNVSYTDYQAEDADFTGTVKTDHLNYTGTGFIDFLTSANYITFTVCQQAAGSQTVKFRYSFAKDETRTGTLFVNNVQIGPVLFPRTTTFDEWVEAVATVSLQQGINTIKVTWDATDGPNLDKMSISGAQCSSYTLTVAATNGGSVTKSPSRSNNKYFDVEQVTLTAVNPLNATFTNWSGDLTGSTNPSVVSMTSNKTITANFDVVSTYTLTLNKIGIGDVSASPAGPTYAAGTVVTLTATPLLGNTFINWTGDASGTNTTTTVTMSANKTVTGNFTSNYTFDFNHVVGYAGMAGDGFAGPTIGGNNTTQPVLCINGPSEFNKLCEALYYRQRVWRGATPTGGMLKQPLIILIKAGTYDASQTLSTIGSNVYGNDMLDIPEQGDLTFIGEGNVTFNFGINVKRAYNVIIRNISFHSYGDDGINIGYPETHHIWVDHCTFGHPTTLPANTEIPDGTSEVKDGASFITISWCKYQNHWKTCLMGHSDNNGGTDAGRLKVTYYGNYFYSTNSRHPRTRFGNAHVLNNMYENVGLGRTGHFGYGIGASNSSSVWAEGNFFLDTRWPMLADRSTADFATVYGALTSPNSNIACTGLKSVNNAYDDSGLTATIVGQVKADMINPSGLSVKFDELNASTMTYNPSNDYNYASDVLPAAAVRVLIPQYAGADKMNWGVTCSIIPLDLVGFSAKKAINNTVLVNWTTANEQSVSHFELERSTDGQHFTAFAQVPARNTKSLNDYVFADKGPLSNLTYYRLKMVDLDNKFVYSKVVSVNLDKTTKQSLTITPSVSSDFLTLDIVSNEAATLTVADMLGRVVWSKNITPSDNLTRQPLTVSTFPNGIYTVVLASPNGKTVGRFVKQ